MEYVWKETKYSGVPPADSSTVATMNVWNPPEFTSRRAVVFLAALGLMMATIVWEFGQLP